MGQTNKQKQKTGRDNKQNKQKKQGWTNKQNKQKTEWAQTNRAKKEEDTL